MGGIFLDLEKRIADLEVQVQNQQKQFDKLINYLGVDFSKSPKQVLNKELQKISQEEYQSIPIQLNL